MSENNNFDSYIKPFYSLMKSEKKDISTKFSRAFKFFLMQYPEFSTSQSYLEFLHYCLEHYINIDPELRDLPIREKLMRAGEMAKNLLSIMNDSKA